MRSEAESEVPVIQCKELWLESRLCCHVASAWLVRVLFDAFVVSPEHLS